MTRFALAAALAAHGVIHLIGFVVPWGLAAMDGFRYRTTVLGGAADLGDLGVRAVGVLWLACTIGFLAAAMGVARRAPWALRLSVSLASASVLVCLLGLPETFAGIAVNVAILAGAAWVARTRSHPLEVAS